MHHTLKTTNVTQPMKNAFRTLALVGSLAAGILGVARPAAAALVVRQIQRFSHISTIIEWDPNGSAAGSRSFYTLDPGLLEYRVATNTTRSSTHVTASASHACDFRTNEHSIHLTFDGQSEISHSETSLNDGITRISAESQFSGILALSADTAFSYTLIPFRSESLTNADASILFERVAQPSNYVGVGAGILPSGVTVWETNATMALSGIAPAGDYLLSFDVVAEVIDENSPATASAGFASLNGFEFRATTLPSTGTPPRLEVSSVGGNVILSWSMADHAFDLEGAQAVDGVWLPVPGIRTLVGDRLVMTVATTGASRFFRLKTRL